ncbi:TPA: hypothetical protein ACVU46_004508 [Vibrio parahaemolyticus]
MSVKVRIIIILLIINFIPNAFAEVKLTNALAKDIGKTYGYYLGQNYSLDRIENNYPHMSGAVLVARTEFSARFKRSIDGMDLFMTNSINEEWVRIKKQLNNQISGTLSNTHMSEYQSSQFIELVRERAKGKIESPILETLLMFNSSYENKPEKEFLDGYKYKYISNGDGKSKGVAFSIEVPKTWLSKEAGRPNIVQKFVSENGRGTRMFMVLIHNMPLQPGEEITERDISDFLNPKEINNFIPDGATADSYGKLTLEGLPGYWIKYNVNYSRMRDTINMECIGYTIFYKNKMIQLQGQVHTSINGKIIDKDGLEKYENLFDQMANTLVLTSIYR